MLKQVALVVFVFVRLQRVRVLGRRRRGTTPEDRLRDLDLQNQAMNLRLIAEVSKSCPVCGMATIKNEGCNKMTCGNCNQHWCWKCKQVRDSCSPGV